MLVARICCCALRLPSSTTFRTSPTIRAFQLSRSHPSNASRTPIPRRALRHPSPPIVRLSLPRISRARFSTSKEDVSISREKWWPILQSFVMRYSHLERLSMVQLGGGADAATVAAELPPAVSRLSPQEVGAQMRKLEFFPTAVTSVQKLEADMSELRQMAQAGLDAKDDELVRIATEDLSACEQQLAELRQRISERLFPEENADRSLLLEVRAGTGGDEAALFSGVLFDAYEAYSRHSHLRFEMIQCSRGDVGGYKEITAQIKGAEAYSLFRFESGVHRVQRVPATESMGRVHTSTVTVAVMPEPKEIDVQLPEKDLKIEFMRAGGPGGQHVNKTDSACRITHLPTGINVYMQEDRSQHKNKERAMLILRSRIFEKKKSEQEESLKAKRKGQIGTGSRSERIRTYNYKEDRVTDHRCGLTLYEIPRFEDGTLLPDMLPALRQWENSEKLRILSEEDPETFIQSWLTPEKN